MSSVYKTTGKIVLKNPKTQNNFFLLFAILVGWFSLEKMKISVTCLESYKEEKTILLILQRMNCF